MPIAAIGNGKATQMLNETASDGSRRTASAIGIIVWFRASAIADWPPATNGSHHGHCAAKSVWRSHRCRDQKKNERSRTKKMREVVKSP